DAAVHLMRGRRAKCITVRHGCRAESDPQPDGDASMDARDATANNADLWTHYLRQQWGQVFDPFGLADAGWVDAASRIVAEVAAANVAGALTMLVAPQVGRMFQANAPEVTRWLDEARAR